MEKIVHKIIINAPRSKVWETLWGSKTYTQWSSVLSEGSKAETNWEEGSKVLFLNSENEGLLSRITRRKDHEVMSFKHIGIIKKDGTEDTSSDEVKNWAGAEETYTLRSKKGQTEVEIKMDIEEKYKDHFQQLWPLALDKLKMLSEEPESK